jgi:hypothetical protein
MSVDVDTDAYFASGLGSIGPLGADWNPCPAGVFDYCPACGRVRHAGGASGIPGPSGPAPPGGYASHDEWAIAATTCGCGGRTAPVPVGLRAELDQRDAVIHRQAVELRRLAIVLELGRMGHA